MNKEQIGLDDSASGKVRVENRSGCSTTTEKWRNFTKKWQRYKFGLNIFQDHISPRHTQRSGPKLDNNIGNIIIVLYDK